MYGAAALFFFLDRRHRGAADPRAARGAQRQAAQRRPVQPGVHDARHDHDLPGRHADRRGVHELPDPAAGRGPRRRLPPPERVRLLGVPRSAASCSTRRGSSAAAPTAAGSTTPRTTACAYSPTHGIDFWNMGLLITGIASLTGAINLIVTCLNMRAPGHDADEDAGVHLDGPGHAVPAAVRHPGAHRRAVPADVRPALRRQLLQRRRQAPTRCSGSTCSGSSGTPRSTS